jgi:hypothetical protein
MRDLTRRQEENFSLIREWIERQEQVIEGIAVGVIRSGTSL